MRVWGPDSAVSSSFKNFPIPVGRTLLLRNSAIVIAAIVDFACYESSGGIRFAVVVSLALAFAALLIVLSFCVDIQADVIILPLILSSRTVL